MLSSTGFSYAPEDFTDRNDFFSPKLKKLDGIFFYNFGWKDMTATEPVTMLKIMDTIDFSLKNGKKVI